jgi:hypothetical protein
MRKLLVLGLVFGATISFNTQAADYFYLKQTASGHSILSYDSATGVSTLVKAFDGVCDAACNQDNYLRADRISQASDGDLIVRNSNGTYFRIDSTTRTISTLGFDSADLKTSANAIGTTDGTDSSGSVAMTANGYQIFSASENEIGKSITKNSDGSITLGSAVKATSGAISDTSGNNIISRNSSSGAITIGGAVQATSGAISDTSGNLIASRDSSSGAITLGSAVKATSGAISDTSGNNIISRNSSSGAITIGDGIKLATGALQDSSGNNIISKNSDGAVHIGENSLVTVEENGKQSLYATDSSSNKINIDVNNGSDLLVNGTSVMGSIRGLANGVKGTTALNAAFSAVPTLSGDREYECGMGYGQYGGKHAVATSCGARINDQTSANLGISYMTGGSESYLLGDMPSVAVRAGITFKFGKSYSSPKTAALDAVNQTAMNEMTVSELKREVSDLRHQLAEMQDLKKTVAHLATLVNQNKGSATLASLQQ